MFDIERMQVDIDVKLNALAAAGPSENSVDAQCTVSQLRVHLPKPKAKLAICHQSAIEKVKDAMDRARKADAAGDKTACESALHYVGRLISAK